MPAVAKLNRHVHDLHVAAEPADFHVTEAVEVEAFFAMVLSNPMHLVFVAEASEPVGYIWADEMHRPRNAFTNERHLAYVHHVAVDATHRRAGVGSSLLRAVESEARARGLADIALDHWSFNSEASAFFSSLGFESYNVRMRRSL